METNLTEIDSETIPGRTVGVTQNNIRNPRLHRALEQTSRLCLFLLECDSNNTSSKVKPSDVRYIRQQWDICKSEFAFSSAEENNDLPHGAYEYAYKIYTPDQREIQRVTNVKIRAVLAEIWDTMNQMLSVDSSNTQGYIAAEDVQAIAVRHAFVDRVLDRWVGNGQDLGDTGLLAPAYELLGKVSPALNSDYAQKVEPSKDQPLPRNPDVPDTPLRYGVPVKP